MFDRGKARKLNMKNTLEDGCKILNKTRYVVGAKFCPDYLWSQCSRPGLDRHRKKIDSKSQWFWLLFILFCYDLTDSRAIAQIIPDRTLPNPSMINAEENVIRIDGGTTAGGNLFHSFSEFSVPTGAAAFFNNAVTIQNILTRVTGNNISNIDGLIRANGTANLFLINPNGLIFGENAQLAIGGSFFGSSAESVLFPNGLEYNANVGAGAIARHRLPLLSVNVPIGLQMGENSGRISVNGTGVSDIVPTDNFGLAVAPGHTVALVGNQIDFNGGIVTAPSGRIEIGSVGNGQVGIVQTPIGFQLNYDNVNQFGNIQLSNRSSLFSPGVVDNPLSEINVTGSNIILDGSQIVSVTDNNAKSAKITVNAAESLELGGTIANFPFSSWIVNQVAPGATGNSGDIQVIAPQISINNGARIQTLSLGSGTAGNVNVEAADSINITGFGLPPDFNLDQSAIDPETLLEQNTNSRISSENFAGGAGGTVTVSTKNLNFLAGGQIATLASSQATANPDTIHITAETIAAENAVSFNPLVPSGIASYTLGQVAGGDINISTEKLNLVDGAFVLSWTQGSGEGGEIFVNATDSITARGINPGFTFADSGIGSVTLGSGTGGNIRVSTQQISLEQGGHISSRTLIELAGVSVANGGTGRAGNVRIDAEIIELTGTSFLEPANITIIGSLTFGEADAGDIEISTKKLRVIDGARVSNAALLSISVLGEPFPGSGTGNSGNVTVNASESIELIGSNPFISSSFSFIGTQNFVLGNAGELTVNAPRLVIREGGFLGTRSAGAGNAGKVTINGSDIVIDGTSSIGTPSSLIADAFTADEQFQEVFFTNPIPTGNTGELTVNASSLTIANGAEVSVEHQGTGNAGRLQINVDLLTLDRGGKIDATTASGFGGNVEINVGDLLQLRNGSQINVEAQGDIGDGGNLTLNADIIVALENSDIIANSLGGNGGNIKITTRGIFGTEFRPNLTPQSDITASSQLGVAGTVTLNTPEIDASGGLVDLPENTDDEGDRLVPSCGASSGSRFTVTGRGGLPADPTQPLRGSVIWRDLQDFTRDEYGTDEVETISNLDKNRPEFMPLIEATNWAIAPDGTVLLLAEMPENSVVSLSDYQCR